MKYAISICIIAILLLIYFNIKSCNNISSVEQSAKTLILKNDSERRANLLLLDSNYILNIQIGQRDVEYNRVVDSFTNVINDGKKNLKLLDTRVKNLISTIHEYGILTKDSTVNNQADSLQQLYNLTKENIEFLLMDYDQRDSVLNGRLAFKDSVITVKEKTIQQLNVNYQEAQKIIVSYQALLDKSIKSGKRKNILRAIAEAVLVVALIFKK